VGGSGWGGDRALTGRWQGLATMKNNKDLENLLKKNKHLRVISGGRSFDLDKLKEQVQRRDFLSKIVHNANNKKNEAILDHQWKLLELDRFFTLEKEYKFHTERKWRFDYAIVSPQIAIEIEGGGFLNSRHKRPEGYENDCIKYNEAQRLGWAVLRFTANQVKSGYAIDYLEKFLREFVSRSPNESEDEPVV
jgi:very-short-patch-repair endonuclease